MNGFILNDVYFSLYMTAFVVIATTNATPPTKRMTERGINKTFMEIIPDQIPLEMKYGAIHSLIIAFPFLSIRMETNISLTQQVF